jgi:hypothetical protein
MAHAAPSNIDRTVAFGYSPIEAVPPSPTPLAIAHRTVAFGYSPIEAIN